ncbi:MAG: GHKL domain-containing protein [Salinivirgaceae bacterium]|nr:GHKL domain-containing protein [Salinivirgaceae bacterium]
MHFLARHRLLFYAIICFAVGLKVLSSDGGQKNIEPERQKFIQVLHEKELLAEQLADTLFEYAQSDRISEFANGDNPRPDRLFDRHGIILYVYSGRNLVYWTNNSIAIPDGTMWYKQPFVNTGNACVIPRYKTNKQQTVVSVIVVKTDFTYENEFLQNKLHSSFGIKSNLSLNNNDRTSENAVYSTDGNYLFSFSLENTNDSGKRRRVAFPLLLLSFVLLMLYAQKGIKKNRLSNRKFFALTLIAVAARIGIQIFLPQEYYSQLGIFSPQHYAASVIFPSLGDLLISVVMIVYLIFVYSFKVHLQRLDKYSLVRRIAISVLWVVALMTYYVFLTYTLNTLIHDSNFPFEIYEITNLNIYGVLGYLILALCFVGFLLLLDKAVIQLLKTFSFWRALLIVMPVWAIATTLLLCNYPSSPYIQMCVSFLVVSVLWLYLRYTNRVNYASEVMVIGLISIYVTNFTRIESRMRHAEENEVLCVNLSQMQDPAAEVILSDIINNMKADKQIATILAVSEYSHDDLYRYIENQYFNGYLNRYNFSLTVCDQHDEISFGPDQNQQNCHQYYNRYLRQYGSQTPVQGLFRIKNASSETSYLIRIAVPSRQKETVTLFFSLAPKLNYEVLGYPELLLEKPLSTDRYKQHISYAKYQNGRLTARSGTFPYAFDNQVYGQHDGEFSHFSMEHYDHVMYVSDSENCIIVSTPTITAFNIMIALTYTFVFFLLIITLLLVLGNSYTKMFDIRFTIKNKVLVSILVILIISTVSVAGGVVYYTINQYKRSQNEIMSSKVQSALMEIEQRYSNITDIKRIPADELNSLMASISNTLLTDINLYDQTGNLIATSRREIYSRKLTSEKMNATAFRELEMNKKSRIVQSESIGKLNYYSAYVPFINSRNKLLAYINLPYFIKQTPLRQELTSVSVAVINIYAVLVVLSVVIAIFLSNRITRPIVSVQERIRSLDLGKSNQRVEYDGDDEIAELVNEYNLMLEQLSISASRLAKSERESAWREMARQVAHEIKNPLTPMKLSVQLLERSQRNGDPDFNERFENTARTLIEQIDSLSSIASEFSQFARMPEGRTELVNLNERINQSVELFRDTTTTKITFVEPAGQSVNIIADNERMLQVFNNLIKNAIQAIPKKQKGKINISLRCMKGRAIVEIQDNGTGISPETEKKLFQPNFTTKTSGTGLGLAIVKNIVEDAGGAIWFYSKVGKGTSFFVSFPLPQEQA